MDEDRPTPESRTSSEIVALLAARLADAIDLMLMAKLAQWNVEAPACYELDSVFKCLHADITEHVDFLAERSVQLGGQAVGGVRQVAAATQLDPYPQEARGGRDHLAALGAALERFCQLAGEAEQQARENDDPFTEGIFRGVRRDLEAHGWRLRSLLEAARSPN
jgi:starvation-inducible DNA-binding protein